MARLHTIYLLAPSKITQRNIYLVQILSIFRGLASTALVALVTFAIVLLSSPALLQESKYLSPIYSYIESIGQERAAALAVGLAIAAFVLLMLMHLLAQLFLVRLSALVGQSYLFKALRNSLSIEYELSLARTTDESINKMQGVVVSTVNNTIEYGSTLISTTVNFVLVASVLIAINPYAAFFLCFTLLFIYVGIYYLSQDRLRRYGEAGHRLGRERIKTLRQGFSGYLEVFFMEKTEEYIENMRRIFQEELRLRLRHFLMKTVPDTIIKLVTIVVLISIGVYILVFSEQKEGLTSMIIFIGAATRILPLIVRYHAIISSSQGGTVVYEKVLEELVRDPKTLITHEPEEKPSFSIKHFDSVELKNIDYTYPNQDKTTIKNLSFSIKAGQSVVLCGRSGAGKTTVAKLCCGLLLPQGGRMMVNGHSLDNIYSRKQWYRLISYIPQKPFFASDTIAANIAFELDHRKIVVKRVEEALDKVELLDFVRSLREGIHTQLGDSATTVSGGQAQRFAIARALYRDFQLLVMDEATNALDSESARKVVYSIARMKPKKALLVISHSLESLQIADEICLVDYGELVTRGSYQDLLQNSELFCSLIKQYTGENEIKK
ncbi:MAG: ATP-binding cassette domain-containing protein [Candidatus Oxydemutatoraceae bacterium WSBS_2016_MAG_OTU14]